MPLLMVRGFRKAINSFSLFPQSHELDEDEELAEYIKFSQYLRPASG